MSQSKKVAHKKKEIPFNAEEDLLDYQAVKRQFEPREEDCLILMTCNLGDGNRLLAYVEEVHVGAEPVYEGDLTCLVVAVRCRDAQHRSQLLRAMMDDLMLGKKVDRFYLADSVVPWQADWPMQLVKRGLLDGDDRVFRLQCAPRKMEQEFVVQVEDTCGWMNRSPPRFAPTNFTHAISAISIQVDGKPFIAWSVMDADLMYIKPPNPWVDDKISRAYYKLHEALERFPVPLLDVRKAMDVGAAPGGWTQCLIDRMPNVTVYAIDAGKLELKEDMMKNVVWLEGLSTHAHVQESLRQNGPFDLLVCDMNQYPDELARCLDDMIPFLVKGGLVIVTIKLMHLRPEQRLVRKYSRGSNRLVKHFVEKHGMELVGVKWLLQNKNERTAVFRKLT